MAPPTESSNETELTEVEIPATETTDDGKEEIMAAPQAQEIADEDDAAAAASASASSAASSSAAPDLTVVHDGVDGGEDMEYVKLSPLDVENQRRNLKDMLLNNSAAPTLPVSTKTEVNDHDEAQQRRQHQEHRSALHQDEYDAHYNIQEENYDPHYHESALEPNHTSSCIGIGGDGGAPKPFMGRQKHHLLANSGGRGGRHSHPRKSPYKSEVARLRHAQLEREAQQKGIAPLPFGIKDTTAPPDTAYFSKQSAKLKETVLSSLGEFLTSAFADDEENSGSYFSEDFLEQLALSNPRLKGVWLQSKNLTDVHVQQLCDALIRNKVVTEVWLPSNRITDIGAGYIAHMLKFNRHIKELFLGNNDIGPKGASMLAAALARGNTTLMALGLGDNHIGVEGAGAFAAALRHNHSLQTLDIKNNGIPPRSSIRSLLSKMLEFNLSDPWDESLVLGLQEELADLVRTLPPEEAEKVVLMAEEALKTAMLCMKRGDKVGAAEAESVFIRICTTGKPPVDPPGVLLANEMRPPKPMDPEEDEMSAELSALELDAASDTVPIKDSNDEGGAGDIGSGNDAPTGGEDEQPQESENTDELKGGSVNDAPAADEGEATIDERK
jgi:hypothetical protein